MASEATGPSSTTQKLPAMRIKRMPREIDQKNQAQRNDQEQKPKEDSAALEVCRSVQRCGENCDHLSGSRLRRRSAACSGKMPLK